MFPPPCNPIRRNRAETLATLKGLAMDVLGPAALEQLGPKQPLYTYTSAKTLSPNSAGACVRRFLALV